MSQETTTSTNEEMNDELRDEYDETMLKNGVRGKYTERYARGTNVVKLAPDLARAFPTEEAVNEALRLVMQMARIPKREVDIVGTKE